MNTRRVTALLAAGLTTVVVAGCATSVAGTAEPNAAALAALTTSSASSASTQSSTSSVTESTTTSPTERSTDSSSTAPTAPSRGSSSGYPSTPQQLPATPRTDQQAVLLESRRIAGFLVVPTLIDPKYQTGGGISTVPFKDPSALSLILLDPVPAVAERGGMIAGFSSSRSTKDNKSSIVVAALEYPDPASATKAATDLAAAAADKQDDTGKATVPGFPAAVGWVGKTSDNGVRTHVFLAQGAMVLYAWLQDAAGAPPGQAAMMAKVLQAETKTMAAFKPLAKADLAKQPNDVDGLRAHTVPQTADNASVREGLYSGYGELHYDTDPVGTQRVFADAGVDLVSQGRLTLYRAKDQAGAGKVRDDFINYTQSTDPSWKPYKYPGDIPGISCVQQSLNSVYYCVAPIGRYAVEGSASSEADLTAAFNAQRSMLQGY